MLLVEILRRTAAKIFAKRVFINVSTLIFSLYFSAVGLVGVTGSDAINALRNK